MKDEDDRNSRSESADANDLLWKEMNDLAAEIGAAWKGPPSGAEAVSEDRREFGVCIDQVYIRGCEPVSPTAAPNDQSASSDAD